jgi:hypothetical protein
MAMKILAYTEGVGFLSQAFNGRIVEIAINANIDRTAENNAAGSFAT